MFGGHVAFSAPAVPRFLARFEEVYRRLGKTETILAAAAAHHRLVWIHPFLDGNGRVARLMSHATLLEALDTGAVWSVARGLSRNVAQYKSHLAACDETRRNDLDGRDNLSEEALAELRRARFREQPGSTAAGFSGGAGIALDARAISGREKVNQQVWRAVRATECHVAERKSSLRHTRIIIRLWLPCGRSASKRPATGPGWRAATATIHHNLAAPCRNRAIGCARS